MFSVDSSGRIRVAKNLYPYSELSRYQLGLQAIATGSKAPSEVQLVTITVNEQNRDPEFGFKPIPSGGLLVAAKRYSVKGSPVMTVRPSL